MRRISLAFLIGVFVLSFCAVGYSQNQGDAEKKAEMKRQLQKEQRSIVPKLTAIWRRLAKTNEDVKKIVDEIKELEAQLAAKKKERDAKLREISPEYKELAEKLDGIKAKLAELRPPKRKRGRRKKAGKN